MGDRTVVRGAGGDHRDHDLFAVMRYIPFTLCVFFAFVLVIMIIGVRYGNFP